MTTITKYWKDDIYITVYVKNCGVKTRTFYVGCNIISPSGWVTESKDFYYGGQTYLPITLDTGATHYVTFRENLGHGLTSESQIIGTHKIVTCVYQDLGLTKWAGNPRENVDYIQIVARPIKACSPNWSTGSWGTCSSSGTQTRSVTDLNNCGTTSGKPATSQSCTPTTCQWKIRSGYPQYAQKPDGTWGYKWSFTNVSTGASTLVWTTSSSKSSLPSQFQCGV